MALLLLAGCGHGDRGALAGTESAPPADFRFLGHSSPCYLELPTGRRSLRVNCFHIDGVLHIHSNRLSKWPRLRGESWVTTVRRDPRVRVQISEKIYPMSARAVEDETRRVTILRDRGYWHAWDGITVFSFRPRI